MDFRELFRSFSRSHGRFKVTGVDGKRGKVSGRASTVNGAPPESAWTEHLSGTGAGLGLIPLLDDNNNVHWGAIDVDIYPLDYSALESDCANLPLTLTKSKSGGAHLWLFLSEPTPASLVRTKLMEWASALGYGGAEVFPKQDKRVSNEDVGNWINLPYYGDTRHAIFNGQDAALEKFLELAEARRITAAELESIEIDIAGDGQQHFSDGPPCLQHITAGGISEGGRNNTLFAVGIYLKAKFPDEWKERLQEFNQANVPEPLPPHEIDDTCKSLERRNYNYPCSKHPLAQHCNRNLCLMREFGVAAGDDELNISLTGLTKLTTQPPRWFVNIDGVRVELENTADLLSQVKFERFAVESVHKVLTPISLLKWRKIVQTLLDEVEVVEAPPEASPEGQFIEQLQHYIELKGQPDSRDALLQGRVFLEEGWAYFRSSDLFNWLRREGFRDLKQTKIYSLLNDLGLKKGRFNAKGTTVSYWKVPVNALQSEAFDVPKFNDPFGEEPKQ